MIFVTSYSPEGARQYGERFVESWHKFNHTLPLLIYEEDPCYQHRVGNVHYRNLWGIPGCRKWVDFYSQIDCMPLHWTTNAPKWGRKVFAQYNACQEAPGLVYWIDADVIVESEWDLTPILAMLGDVATCYMGRKNYHPCTSFVGFNTEHPSFGLFMEYYLGLYLSGSFLMLKEWHDCAIYEKALKDTEPAARNVTPEGEPTENVFDTLFSGYARHLKGPVRKAEAVCDAISK